jgi:hypothetical protein
MKIAIAAVATVVGCYVYDALIVSAGHKAANLTAAGMQWGMVPST